MAAKKTDEGKKRPAKASGKGNTVKSGNKKSSKRMEDSNITKEADHVMDEVFLVITLLVSLLLILSYVHLCGPIGEFLNFITFGFMGVIAYVFPFLLFFAVAFSLSNRGNKMANRRIYSGIGLFFVLAALIQLISGYEPEISVFGYFKQCGEGQSGGGFAGSILLKLFYKSFGEVATALILIALALIFFMLLTGKTIFSYFKEMRKITGMNSRRMQEEEEYIEEYEEETLPKRRSAKIVTLHKSSELAENVQAGTAPEGEAKPKEEPQSFIDALKNIGKKGRTENRKQDFNKQEQGGSLQETEVISKEDKKLPQGKYDMEEILPDSSMDRISITGSYMQEKADSSANLYEEELKRKFGDADKKTEVIPEKAEDFADDLFPAEAFEESRDADAGERLQGNEDIEKDKRGDTHTPVSEHTKEKAQKQPTAQGKNTETADFSDIGISPVTEPVKPYVFPPIDLLGKPPAAAKGMTERDLKETAFKLQSTLDSFGVKVSITNVSCGPAVTRYELSPEQGVKVSKITSLSDDIKLNLAASDIRIEAPISGKAAVGIEVPNKEVSPVFFRELIEHADFKAHPSDVAFGVGKDIGGQVVVTDIAKMPHLLIAGATGSGKSVCINTLIMSILYKSKPSDVRLIMIDPKVVELSVYNGIPHLLIPVVTDPKKASAALNWAVMEMTDRYNKFAELGVRDLKGYNAKVAEIEDLNDPKYQKMPQMVIIVDELADLMMVASSEVETAICRLAQMARAAGMHLIIATQRPSVNVITGVIKANVPSRIAFSVSSAIDSRTIIDSSGAESLLGKGDMLFFPSGIPKPVRVQGAFVSDKEVSAVVEFLKTQNESTSYNAQVNEQIANAAASSMTELSASSGGNERDDYFIEAGKFIIEKEKASIGMLQRIYKIGFNRAARIMDQLADAGVVGPEEGTKPRKILMTMEEFEQYVDEYV